MKRLEDGDYCDQKGSDQCQIYIRLKVDGSVICRNTAKPNYGYMIVDMDHTCTSEPIMKKKTPVEIEAFDFDPLSADDKMAYWDITEIKHGKHTLVHEKSGNKLTIDVKWFPIYFRG